MIDTKIIETLFDYSIDYIQNEKKAISKAQNIDMRLSKLKTIFSDSIRIETKENWIFILYDIKNTAWKRVWSILWLTYELENAKLY